MGAVGARCLVASDGRATAPPAADSTASSSFRRARRRARTSCARRVAQLAQLRPAFCSVTFGAGGSTREGTLATVLEIRARGPRRGAARVVHRRRPPRACARCSTRYRAHGIRHLVALRGDLPSGTRRRRRVPLCQRARRLHPARDGRLVPHRRRRVSGSPIRRRATRSRTSTTSRARSRPAPTRRSPSTSTTRTRTGASSTPARTVGLTVPIVPGIMPIASFTKLARFSDACGAEIPRWIRRRLEGFGDDSASIRAFGLDVVTSLCGVAARSAARRGCTSSR